MKAQYSFKVEPACHLVRIRMAGFFRQADVAAFLEARRVAHQKLRCPPNAHVTLTDIRKLDIQSHDVVDAFQAVLAAPFGRARRLAIVAGRTLARAQALRALGSGTARWFTDPIQAEAWLLADEADEAPLRRAAG